MNAEDIFVLECSILTEPSNSQNMLVLQIAELCAAFQSYFQHLHLLYRDINLTFTQKSINV